MKTSFVSFPDNVSPWHSLWKHSSTSKFSKWSPKEVKDSNQSTSTARPAGHCRPKNKFAIPPKNNSQHDEKIVLNTCTVLCKRNANEIRCFSLFDLAKIRRNFATKFRQSAREFSSSQTKFLCHLGEISHPLKRNFAIAKIRARENSQLRNFHKAKFCWQWRRVVIKTFCSDRFKSLARVIYLV